MTQHVSQAQAANAPEIYADLFVMHLQPYGVKLQFGAAQPIPPAVPGQAAPQKQNIIETARVNMSLEHLKVMAFAIARDLLNFEKQTKWEIDVPEELLINLKTSREEWRKFWYGWVVTGQPWGPTVLKDGKTPAASDQTGSSIPTEKVPEIVGFPFAGQK